MNRYPRRDSEESEADYQDRIDAYDSIDWYEEGKEAELNREDSRLTPYDGNYSLDDLPF